MKILKPSSADIARYWSDITPYSPSRMVREAIRNAGKDPSRLSVQDIELLSPLTEFHCLAREATIDLANLLKLEPDTYVLDVGSGIGGPSLRLAHNFGCRVTGIDITRAYHDVAVGLAEAMGFSHRRVEYFHGDAIDMPFGDAVFDVAWMQTTDINIVDRDHLYKEIYRVLKPGGRLAIYDLFAGPSGSPHYPVPWAYDDATSALLTQERTESTLASAGFRILATQDVSDRAKDWYRSQVIAYSSPKGPPALGHHVLLPDWRAMALNQWRNLREERIFFAYLICERL